MPGPCTSQNTKAKESFLVVIVGLTVPYATGGSGDTVQNIEIYEVLYSILTY